MTQQQQPGPLDPARIREMAADPLMREATSQWFLRSCDYRYSYNFSWMGRPIIQYPQDMVAMQEIIWRVKPDFIVETGIAHGGSLVYYASLLELIGAGTVLGIDIDIRPHNRDAILKHPMAHRIRMIEGSAVEEATAKQVRDAVAAAGAKRVLVVLDSNHTHQHVSDELRLYAPLVKKDSYVVVFDTVVEHMPKSYFPDRAWGPGNNPLTAVKEFLKSTDRFVIDEQVHEKLQITVAPSGYLKCVKD